LLPFFLVHCLPACLLLSLSLLSLFFVDDSFESEVELERLRRYGHRKMAAMIQKSAIVARLNFHAKIKVNTYHRHQYDIAYALFSALSLITMRINSGIMADHATLIHSFLRERLELS
jgi:hypothetical protein